MAKLRKKKNETQEQFDARVEKQANEERINNLEKGMGQLVDGMNNIMEKLQDKPSEQIQEVSEQVGRTVIELPDSHISLGEIKLRRDLAEFLIERVSYLRESKQRPNWTVEREIEMMVKYTKKTAEHSQAAAESRTTTISGQAV